MALHTVDIHMRTEGEVSVGSIPSDYSAGDGEIGNLTVKSRVCLFNLQSMVPRMIKLASFGGYLLSKLCKYDKHIYLRPGCPSLINYSFSITNIQT
jgi:hypothetical protein